MPRKMKVNKAVVPRVRNTNRGRRGTKYTRYFPTPNEMSRYKAQLKSAFKKVGLGSKR
jgi:hypothetical protein